MKPLLVLCLFVFGLTSFNDVSAQSPVANAGPDQTIYLSQTNTATLDGSASSGSSYQWTEVSTDYKSGATITSPNSATTTVTGLPQGVFYFQLAVTSGGSTATDIVVVRVNYDLPPPNSTLLRAVAPKFSEMVAVVNDRNDTTNFIAGTESRVNFPDNPNAEVFYDRARSNDLFIDSQLGKFYSIVEDGYQWNNDGYSRSEMSFGDFYTIDSNKTYRFEWKGYFPQDMRAAKASYNKRGALIMQIHGGPSADAIGDGPMIELLYLHDSLGVQENFLHAGSNGDNGTPAIPKEMFVKGLIPINTLYNQAHTITLTIREGKGYVGQKAFIELKLDGQAIYYRNNGNVFQGTGGDDYIKFATFYDYDNNFSDPNNFTRHKKTSVVTEEFNIYQISDAVLTIPPVANAGSNQTITLPANTVDLSASGSISGETIQSYNWTKSSGPSGESITSPNSSSTSVTNLTQGTYVFQLKVTDNNGATATSSVQITVNAQPQNAIPKAKAGADQTITLPINSANLTGSGSDNDGTITAYEWTKINGHSGVTINSPSSANTAISNLQQGEYTFQLKVTDNSGATGTDTVHVTVNAANQSPIADAGNDQNIILPTNTANLSGKGTDTDGSIASYQWTKISGNSCTISNPNTSSTSINGLTEGSYEFQLTVTDNQGATGKDTVLVSVKAGANIIPTASAGADQTITLPTNSVNLKGSGVSTGGTISSYSWTKISGPTATILNASSATTNVSALLQGTYLFELKVTDDKDATAKDTVQVTVNPANNIAPTVDAGANQTITLPTNTVTLNGSGSDSDGTIASYSWTKISGPTATISNASSATTTINNLIAGEYTFNLKVTDNQGATGTDTVQVSVKNDTTTQVVKTNIAPTVTAGTDQTITLPTNTVTLNGSGSDSDATIASYSWTKISGPTATILNASSATTNISALLQGTYLFELKVTDDKGATAKDTVQVTVNPANNIAPAANAGMDHTITLPTNTVTLNGSGSDSDGTIASYSWTKISGPTATISNASSATTTINNLIAGEYTFNLKVTDNQGATGTDTVQVSVKNDTTTQVVKTNIAPTASAGTDQTITLPTNTVTLNGTGSDSDGTIASYSWTKISGPTAAISNASSATTNVSGLTQGNYQFELKVTDDKGAIGKDTVQITVLNDTTTSSTQVKANVAPTANAGADQKIILPTNTVILVGSGSDVDGTIASYSWTKISGPSTFSITNSSSATAKVTKLVQGIYQFQLKVTDDKGATSKDTVLITVLNDTTISSTPVQPNVAPTVNAGVDQTISLPTNSVTLDGTGNDTDGTIASYAWTQVSGPVATIANASSATTNVSGLSLGTSQFELNVTDDKGATSKDTVQITVLNSTTATSPVQQNIAPAANAGSDITTVSTAQFVTINGSGTDSDGKIKSYLWTQISGPSSVAISGSNSQTIKIRNFIEGTYEFQLQVTDDKGAIGLDTVKVTVALERTSTNNIVVTTTSLKVYPNPVHDVATVQFSTTQINTNVMIIISDINGKTVYTDQFVSSSTSVQKQINMSNLIKGTYFVTVYFNGIQQQTVKVMRL